MNKRLLQPLFLLSFILLNFAAFAQPQFPCNGDFLFTRQVSPSPTTYLSKVNFGTGDITITNPGTLSPSVNTNASVQYNGYVWTQDWSPSTFTLLRVAADYTTTSFAISGMPTGVDYNNAGVDKNGLMYILKNGNNPVELYTINLSTGTPTYVSTKTVTGLPSSSETVTWGDITIDPITNRVYCWYHPSPAPATNLVGLYEITNISSANPVLVKIGIAQQYTMGSLFFNDRGQLFGYGSSVLSGTQDRIFAIDKATGIVSQYGIPDIGVAQSDGCECAFRISLDRSTTVPIVNLPKCSVDTFSYIFTPRNHTVAAINNITFSDTLDARLSYAFSASALQTQLQTVYGVGVAVAITSSGAGTNNVVNITGMNIPTGANSFSLAVKVDANLFGTSATIKQQAYLKGISVILGGPNERSNYPSTFIPKDSTPITINLNGSRCLPPIADNFINQPMPQGNNATVIPGLVAADPDGTIASFKILTLPAVAEGILSISCPATPSGASCVGNFANLTAAVLTANPGGIVLTPAQAAAMRFDPASNFTGNANFTFNATDNSGNISNTATYVLPVTGQPPVSNNIMENSMVNTNAATPIQGLSSSDIDGTITGYQLLSLPLVSQGVLSVSCPPLLTGATCSGSYQNLTAAILASYPGGIPLTAAQMADMRFDPTGAFVGNATFNYNAIDNSGYVSNTANYTIPVTATPTIARPPLANNIIAQPLNNSLGATATPALKATDLDGTVTSYTITTVPAASTGVISIACPAPTGATCTGGFADLTPAVLAANPGGIVLTPAQAASLRFDPAASFTGNDVFNYFATDNTGLVSNVATYSLTVLNTPPTAVNINTTVAYNASVASIIPLSGTDADGSVTSFTLTTVPTAAQGTLSVPCGPTPSGGTCTGGFVDLTPAVLAANPSGISLTPAQAAAIRFVTASNFSGTASFNYTSTDNNANISKLATYNITITNLAPVANDITVAVMPNTNAATALTALSATDADGTIAYYTINSLPPAASSGVLSLSGTPITIGQVLTPAQISSLQFDPALNYTGMVTFTYTATDNTGNISNAANYNIPVSGVGNLPPVAKNIFAASMSNSNGVTSITALVGSDPDGTVASYTLTSVPADNKGVLSVPCGPTPAGGTCTGGFVDLTPAVLAANPAGIILNATQIAGMRFDPVAGFSGYATFSYFDIDNNGESSNIASYTIPVTGTPPVAAPIVAPAIALTNSATAIPALIASDADGTIANYTIEILPTALQGTLSIPCGPTPNGATCTGGFADLTAAVLAANPGGIVLTPTQMAGMRFDPSGLYSGNVIFNYHATDNGGLISNSTNYTIPVTGLPPVSIDVVAPKMLNSNGPTAIPALVSTDADGTISNYAINSIPPVSQGVLSITCGPTPTGATCTGGFADLTAAVLAANPGGIVLTPAQMAAMRFDPASTYNGNVLFNYTAYDNLGNISNVAEYTVPTGSPAVLPVQQLDVNAVLRNYTVTVNWKTQNEINTSRFYVERSIDNSTFITVGDVAAAGNYSGTKNYNLPDDVSSLAGTGIIYYRIKAVDINGKISYSQTVIVRLSNITGIKTWPNPVKDNITISLYSEFNTALNVRILDATGKTVHAANYAIVKGNNQVNISDLTRIAKGMYIVQLNDTAGSIQFVQKVTKD